LVDHFVQQCVENFGRPSPTGRRLRWNNDEGKIGLLFNKLRRSMRFYFLQIVPPLSGSVEKRRKLLRTFVVISFSYDSPYWPTEIVQWRVDEQPVRVNSAMMQKENKIFFMQ
jgi:hypothetical protein